LGAYFGMKSDSDSDLSHLVDLAKKCFANENANKRLLPKLITALAELKTGYRDEETIKDQLNRNPWNIHKVNI